MWFPLVIILAIYLLIARFYQRLARKRMFFWWYLVPMVFYGASAVRYASVDDIAGDVWGDGFAAIGGMMLMLLTGYLFFHMMKSGTEK